MDFSKGCDIKPVLRIKIKYRLALTLYYLRDYD
jgi:hypothetical protein